MAAWDPFGDPADNEEVQVPIIEDITPPLKIADGVPPNPWEDEVYVELSMEAARLAQEREEQVREESARLAAELIRREQEALKHEVEARNRRVAARASSLASQTLTPEEVKTQQRMSRIQRAAVQGAVDAVRSAPKVAAAKRTEAVKEYYEQEAAGAEPPAQDRKKTHRWPRRR